MPQRTVRDAQHALEELAPQLNPEMWNRLNGELNEVVNATNARATRYMDETLQSASTAAKETLTDLCDVRDQLAALAEQGSGGQLTGDEYLQQYRQLQDRQRSLTRRVEKLNRDSELLEHIEDDPVAWADEHFHQRFPLMRPNFTF